jgi:hypothetical protein
MSKYFWLWSAAAKRCATLRQYRLPAVLAAVALLSLGCTQTPPRLFDGASPADADVRVPPASYRSVLGDYSSQRPVKPMPWSDRNNRVAPAQKQ